MSDKFDYFIRKADERFDRIESKLDKLVAWKWQMIGGAGVAIFIGGLAIKLIN